MSTTAGDFIQDAMEMLGVVNPGEPLADADAQRGLTVLNDMLDSWSNESLTTFCYLQSSFPLVVNKSIYTVGAGGDINITRPIRISDAAGAAYMLDVNSNKYPIDVVDQLGFNLRTTSAVNSNIPDTLYYDNQFPLAKMNVWPIPNDGSYTCYFFSWTQLSDFASLTTVASLPPGYNLAIKTNLAVALKPYFRDAELDPIIALRADKSLANIKRSNLRVQIAVYEPEIIARGQSTYNIRTDRNYLWSVTKSAVDGRQTAKFQAFFNAQRNQYASL